MSDEIEKRVNMTPAPRVGLDEEIQEQKHLIAVEQIGGNVVKEAMHKGILMGLLMAEAKFSLPAQSVRLPEICICAAIKGKDGTIVRGHRHGFCKQATWKMSPEVVQEFSEQCEEGFITSHNRFVSRKEGYALQIMAGIESIAEGGYRHQELFSEDLY